MDKFKLLKEIFENDPFGLLVIKPTNSTGRNEDERLVASFQEINLFYEQNNREPELGGGIQEHQLFSRLKSIRENSMKLEMLKVHDIYGLFDYTPKEVTSLDDVLNDDVLGILSDDDTGLFDLKHVTKFKERESTDFVARRKKCKNFNDYEHLFVSVQRELKEGKRKLLDFKFGNLQQGSFYVHNGLVFFVEKINITQLEHYRADGKRIREDGRTRLIFENGTESEMLRNSIQKRLYENGKIISENVETTNKQFRENFSMEFQPPSMISLGGT